MSTHYITLYTSQYKDEITLTQDEIHLLCSLSLVYEIICFAFSNQYKDQLLMNYISKQRVQDINFTFEPHESLPRFLPFL